MEPTLLVMKLLGVYLVIAGLFMLFKGKTIPHLLRDFFDHPAIVYLSGIILIALSAAYLLVYNIWDGTWQTIVTVIVWLVFIKGIFYIFFPKVIEKFTAKKFRGPMVVYSIVAIVVGLVLYF